MTKIIEGLLDKKDVNEEEINLRRKRFIENIEYPLENVESPNYTRHEINWIEGDSWEKVKKQNIDFLIKEKRLVVLAHYQDKCRGKPQLIHQTIQRIPLIKRTERVKHNKEGETIFTQYKFLDDPYDKRFDGRIIEAIAFDFWVYRLIDKGKEYFLFSEKELPSDFSEIEGMKIDLDDLSGISDTLKINKIATIFLVKDYKSAVSILPKDKLIKFTKEKKFTNGWDAQGFQDYIFTHEDGNIYDYSEDFNMLRLSQLLSGKYEGYPLHLLKMGPVGTGKTTEAESLDFKFREENGILEAGTSRMKVLVPSFKEKPANLGYICNCNRIAIIDELMKMVSNAMQNQHIDINNYFGELNMLLEQKKRLVGSGNDNSVIVKATAKICITTNPIKGKNLLAYHLGVLDNTTLSRMLIWIQDKEETEKIYQKEGIRQSKFKEIREESEGNSSFYHDFLTIYDSCQDFLVEYNKEKVREIFTKVSSQAKEPMKQVWKARGLHHTILLLDGITKYRCLFRDYDSTFKSTEEDYKLLEKIITHMVKTWDSNLEDDGWGGEF